jgi:uncharacterized protein (TIGR02186 family)
MRRAALLALLLAASPAGAETLVVSISTPRVLISSNYTGSSISVFGAVERDAQTVARASHYEVVVTVRGPRQNLTVREKRRVGPIWVNRAQELFPSTPAFVAVLSSGPVATITTEPLRRRFRIGLDAIVASHSFAPRLGPEEQAFREALLRIEKREGLYFEDPGGVTFLTPTIFQATVPVPAIAPPGPYDVEVALFADSVPLTRASTQFELAKSGFEQQVAVLARDWSLVYGAGAAGVALLFGWLASIIFRRD